MRLGEICDEQVTRLRLAAACSVAMTVPAGESELECIMLDPVPPDPRAGSVESPRRTTIGGEHHLAKMECLGASSKAGMVGARRRSHRCFPARSLAPPCLPWWRCRTGCAELDNPLDEHPSLPSASPAVEHRESEMAIAEL